MYLINWSGRLTGTFCDIPATKGICTMEEINKEKAFVKLKLQLKQLLQVVMYYEVKMFHDVSKFK